MKLNNKGFAITIVLYGTFILFLLLILSLLGILSTYKLRLEKVMDETKDIINQDTMVLTCDFTASYSESTTTIKINVNNEALLHEAPYNFFGNDTWEVTPVYYNSLLASYTIRVRDKSGKIVNCGKASLTRLYRYEADDFIYCTKKGTDYKSSHVGGNSTYSYQSAADAISACKICPENDFIYTSGCDNTSSIISKSCSYENVENCNWIT